MLFVFIGIVVAFVAVVLFALRTVEPRRVTKMQLKIYLPEDIARKKQPASAERLKSRAQGVA